MFPQVRTVGKLMHFYLSTCTLIFRLERPNFKPLANLWANIKSRLCVQPSTLACAPN